MSGRQLRVFSDRREAGRLLGECLAEALSEARSKSRSKSRSKECVERALVVLGLPRGGVPIAAEIGKALGAPVDVIVVRKLGAPFNAELAIGAIALGGIAVYNDDLLAQLGLDEEALAPVRARELEELARRERLYRGQRPPLALADTTVIVADDGIATGATMCAAVEAVRTLGPERIVVAAPTAAADAVRRLRRLADDVVVLSTPEPYIAVGAWYGRFDQLSDDEVIAILENAPPMESGGGWTSGGSSGGRR